MAERKTVRSFTDNAGNETDVRVISAVAGIMNAADETERQRNMKGVGGLITESLRDKQPDIPNAIMGLKILETVALRAAENQTLADAANATALQAVRRGMPGLDGRLAAAVGSNVMDDSLGLLGKLIEVYDDSFLRQEITDAACSMAAMNSRLNTDAAALIARALAFETDSRAAADIRDWGVVLFKRMPAPELNTAFQSVKNIHEAGEAGSEVRARTSSLIEALQTKIPALAVSASSGPLPR